MTTRDNYTPPFNVTDEITNLVANIAELVGHLSATSSQLPSPLLRKQNRIKTIQSSLAIENNSLTLKQVSAILEGKRVLGAPNEIKEVENAIDTYNLLLELKPYSEKDLLRAHKLMMSQLVDEAGQYRTKGVGIMGKQGIVNIAPPADRVPFLMKQLMKWVKSTKIHPLISSCVFHYELEFIHPFADGNGRIGRMWQTVLLANWKPIFAWIPVETIVKENQNDYYKAITLSDKTGESTAFITFMLKCLLEAMYQYHDLQNEIEEKSTLKSAPESTPEKIIRLISTNPHITIDKIAEVLYLNRRGIAKHIKSLQEQGILRRVGPNKGGHWETI